MNISVLKPQHQDTVIYKIIETRNSINYIVNEVAPYFGEMEAWEVKEFTFLLDEHNQSIKSFVEYIKEHSEIFGNILSDYNHTIESFLNELNITY